ncbi:hypothetical protein DFH28DRAFT_1075009 [Melampsora americana]|nr:hypothetical protein DFH28DRAFT_1075009 [Melampsora americana]
MYLISLFRFFRLIQCIHVQIGRINSLFDMQVPLTDISAHQPHLLIWRLAQMHITFQSYSELHHSISTKMINLFNIFRSIHDRIGLHELEMTSVDREDANSSVQGWVYEHRWLGSLMDVSLFWLASTFPPVFHFYNYFPMPNGNKTTSYFIKPINPYRPLPLPSSGGDTGLVCTNKTCKTRATHSTRYFASHHKHLVGVQCPVDPSFIRTYNREKLKSAIREINRGPIARAGDLDGNMELHRMLNGPPTPPQTQPNRVIFNPPTPPQTQTNVGGHHALSSFAIAGECKGVNGSIASGHQTRKNAHCTVNACKACCLTINKGAIECHIHGSMARRYHKESHEHGRVSILPSRQNNIINLVSSSAGPSEDDQIELAPGQAARSHGVRPFKGRLNINFLDGYRTKSLQKDAEERQRTEDVATASKTIALVVWPGSKDDPFGSWGGMVHARGWPQFSLEQSLDIKALVTEELGVDWRGNLQVWNDEHQIWLHTAMDILVSYPVDTRKLLVVFPGIKPSACKDIDCHIASVSTGRHKDVMNLTAFIQRTNSVSPQKGKNKRVINLRSPSDSDSDVALSPKFLEAEDVDLDMEQQEYHRLKPTSPPMTRCGRPSTSFHPSEIEFQPEETPVRKKKGWSETATMDELKRMYDLTENNPKKSIRDSFRQVFGERFPYKVSTMSHYCRWCTEIRPARLAKFVGQHGNMKVAEGRDKHFPKEWRVTDSRFQNKDSHPSKRVKL